MPALCYLLVAGMLLVQVPSTVHGSDSLRTDGWTDARHQKAARLAAPQRGPVEGVFFAVEQAVDEGPLGRRLAGRPVYAWLLVLLALTLVYVAARRVLRRYRPRSSAGSS